MLRIARGRSALSRAKGFSGVSTLLDDLVTKIVDGTERNPGDLYRAEKERRHRTTDSRRRRVAPVRSAPARDGASSPSDGSDSCSMRVFINTGRRAGFVKSALAPAFLVRDEGHVLQTSRECRREKASAFRDFRCLSCRQKRRSSATDSFTLNLEI